jgi:two-component system response regulator AtoC
VRGAFEGAFDDRAGRFELAHRGTIFLDEPIQPPAVAQARLLRVLTTARSSASASTDPDPRRRAHRRLAHGTTPRRPGARRACSRARLAPLGLPVRIAAAPRTRKEDIRPLAEHFLRKYARRNARAATSLSDEAKAKPSSSYDFPGNVRELENVIERAAILARGDVIQAEHLAFAPKTAARRSARALARRRRRRRRPADARGDPGRFEARASKAAVALDARSTTWSAPSCLLALARCNGNKAEVARSLGIQRTTLYYRLKKLGIDA